MDMSFLSFSKMFELASKRCLLLMVVGMFWGSVRVKFSVNGLVLLQLLKALNYLWSAEPWGTCRKFSFLSQSHLHLVLTPAPHLQSAEYKSSPDSLCLWQIVFWSRHQWTYQLPSCACLLVLVFLWLLSPLLLFHHWEENALSLLKQGETFSQSDCYEPSCSSSWTITIMVITSLTSVSQEPFICISTQSIFMWSLAGVSIRSFITTFGLQGSNVFLWRFCFCWFPVTMTGRAEKVPFQHETADVYTSTLWVIAAMVTSSDHANTASNCHFNIGRFWSLRQPLDPVKGLLEENGGEKWIII